MEKLDNPQSVRLYESLSKKIGEEKASLFLESLPLSKSADCKKKFKWAQEVCCKLEEQFDEKTIKSVRMDCACGPAEGKIKELKKLYKSSVDASDFAQKATALNQGYTIEYKDGSLFLVYPECYCSCVNEDPALISKTWCYCSAGYVKRMFQGVLEKEVDVEIVESVKLGGKKCVLKIIF